MRRPSPPFVVLLLLIAGCYCVALAKASCGSPATVSPPKTCASQSGCALASLCRLYTRMPYPNSAAATATYAPEVYAQWDDILKGAGPEALPGPYDYTVKTRLRIGNSSGGDTLWPLRFANTGVNYYATEYSNKTTAASPRLPVRGKIEYIVTYTLNVTTEYEAPAGAKVSQTTVNLPTNVDLISGGRLAFPLSGIPTKMIVVFEDPPPTDNYAGIISFGSWRDSYQMDGDNNDGIVRTSPGLQFNIEVSLGDDPDDISIPSATISQNEIISAEQTTVYTWTDYGTAVPTGEDTMGGTCSRGSGVTSHTVTCTVDGLPRYVMLEGDPSIVFDASTSISIRQYRTESSKGAENPKDLAVFKSRQNRTSCGAHGIENKCGDNCNVCDPPTTMTCDPKLNAKEDECMEDSDCFLITHVSGKTCVKNTLPILLDVDHYTNPSDKYAVCGVTTRIEGDVYINDMPDNTKGFYLGGCSGSGVTSIDPRTWDSNNVVSTMTELILDDTSIVSAPDVSSLVNLERLSISGDQYDGTMTTLPNITGLTKLKFFNVSRQPAISVRSWAYSIFSLSICILLLLFVVVE